ncbi:Yokozuna, partial [Phytophthora megakarya]
MTVEEVYTVNYYADVSYFLGLELQWSERGDEVRLGQQNVRDDNLGAIWYATCTHCTYADGGSLSRPVVQGVGADEISPGPAIGALLYLSLTSRPDITTAVRLLAQDLPTDSVKNGVDRVNGVSHGRVVYCDATCAVERDSKSATGYAIYYDDCLVEWGSKKQSMERIGLNMVLKDLSLEVKEILVMEDNQGAQHLAESKAVTQRSRHINTKYH